MIREEDLDTGLSFIEKHSADFMKWKLIQKEMKQLGYRLLKYLLNTASMPTLSESDLLHLSFLKFSIMYLIARKLLISSSLWYMIRSIHTLKWTK